MNYYANILFNKKIKTYMAELDVQPKKRSSNSFLPWLLLALGVIALIFFITRNNDRDGDDARTAAGTTTTYSNTSENAARGDWNTIDFNNSPRASYDEIKGGDVEVNGNDNYAIYKVEEDDLFEDGKTTFKNNADKTLAEVVQSINTRFSSSPVRLYGHSHTQKENENEVSTQRMEMLKNWLNQNGLKDVSIHPMNNADAASKNKTMTDDEGVIRIVTMQNK
jgi:hypothetical protein